MNPQSLRKVEQSLNKSFSAQEIQRLLHLDEQEAAPPQLDEFFDRYATVISSHFSTDNPKEDFKKALKDRLQKIRDLVYFKELEESLSTKVDRRIKKTVASTRDQLEGALEAIPTEERFEQSIRDIRNMSSEEILAGSIDIDDETILEFIDLVRSELKQQIEAIQAMDEGADGMRPENREVLEKSINLIQFLVSQSDLTEASKKYVRAALYKKLRSKDGWKYIRNLYQERYLIDDDSQLARESIQNLIQRTEQITDEGRDEHILEIISQYVPQVRIKEEELEMMRQFGIDQGSLPYEQLIAGRMEEIERARIEIELERMMPEPNQSILQRYENTIAQEAEAFHQAILAFRDEQFTITYLVEQMPNDRADEPTKTRLIGAARFLRDQLGASRQEVRSRLSGLQSPDQVRAFLVECEEQAEQYLREQCQPAFSEEDLVMLRKNDLRWNIYDLVNHQQRFEYRPPVAPSTPGEYLEGDALAQAEEALMVMQGIAAGQFPANDMKRFEEAEKRLEEILKKSTYKTREWMGSAKMKLGEQDIRDQSMEEVELPQRLPPALQARYDAIQHLKIHVDRFQTTRKQILELHDFSNEEQLRKGLTAVFSDYFETRGRRPEQMRKLSKVMTLDHPITSIHFNASNQKPFDTRRGIYDFHLLNGQPATYKDRAAVLLKQVQDLIRSGDYAQLYRLFESGEKADRLYLDSLFFPTSTITNKANRDSILYDTLVSGKESGQQVQVMTSKIPQARRGLFKKFEDPESEACAKELEAASKDKELQDLPDTLAHDQEFSTAFGPSRTRDGLEFHEDGSLTVTPEGYQNLPPELREDLRSLHPEVFQRTGGDVKGVGSTPPEQLKISKETIEELMKNHPLVAARSAQFNSLARGTAIAGLETAGRKAADIARLPFQAMASFGNTYWSSLRFYSCMSIYTAIPELYEHLSSLMDFRVKFSAYTLLKETFAGTIIGSEFYKLLQSKENERVDAFKGAFSQYGNEDIIDKLYNARDRFELKAVLIEGFEHRGLFTIEDILKNDFFKLVNKFHPGGYVIPLDYTDEEMQKDPDIKAKMTNHVREALDKFWGGGTWVGWRSAGASKYESNRKSANDNFNNLTGSEKMKTFSQYWEWLKTPDGDQKLKSITPAELVGNIENDMQRCNRDSGEIFAIMQALICRGYIKLEHVVRLQDGHTNDLPIFALQEPIQAELSGLAGHIDQALNEGKKYDMKENPIIQFYQGKKALALKGTRADGKWAFPKTYQGHKDAEQSGALETAIVTVHQLQKMREAQPEWHRKMDNGLIGIFSAAYPWDQIENGLRPDQNGNIDARPHDIVAAYRGIHEEFASYVGALGDSSVPMEPTEFKQVVWQAYLAISKTQAYAGFLSRHRSKPYDYTFNLNDASPNLDQKTKESRGSVGTSNFEKLILGNTGPQQRMLESQGSLDNTSMSANLRKSFKKMAGYQFVNSLGVDPETGKHNSMATENFAIDQYYPAEEFPKVVKAFYEDVLEKAKARGMYDEIKASLDQSKMADFSVNNDTRQKALKTWMKSDAGL
ncbi:MAG: hypothetical protein AB7J40_04910 [Candidatus Altimarinota bacterium]